MAGPLPSAGSQFPDGTTEGVGELPDANAQEFRALVARRRQLVEMTTAEKNRMRIANPRVRPKVQEHIH